MSYRVQVRVSLALADRLSAAAKRDGATLTDHVRSILEDQDQNLAVLRNEIDRLHAIIERLEPREDDAIAEELAKLGEQMAVLRDGGLAAMEALIMLRANAANPLKSKAARSALRSAGYEPWSVGD